MVNGKKVAVVVPAYNEELLIGRVIETMPDFVDDIVVVDDKSQDNTVERVKSYAEKDSRVILLQHNQNQGVGGAIATGYKWVVEHEIDVAAVMAGDAQMDPADLINIVKPVAYGYVDYAKGNRLFTGESWKLIPRVRYFGNSVLSLLTKIASGYWFISDSQTGYTAVSLDALKRLDLDKIYKRYGMPNDMLVKLNIINARVADVPVKPVYNIGEKSGIKIHRVIFTIPKLLIKLFFKRLIQKYLIRDFHPLFLFYLLGFITLPLGILIGLVVLVNNVLLPLFGHPTSILFSSGWTILSVLLILSGFQSILFAMWFDMENNRHLQKDIRDFRYDD